MVKTKSPYDSSQLNKSCLVFWNLSFYQGRMLQLKLRHSLPLSWNFQICTHTYRQHVSNSYDLSYIAYKDLFFILFFHVLLYFFLGISVNLCFSWIWTWNSDDDGSFYYGFGFYFKGSLSDDVLMKNCGTVRVLWLVILDLKH